MTRAAIATVTAAPNQTVPSRSSSPLLQRKCDCGGSADFSGKCEECGKNRLGVQRRAAGPATGVTPPIVHEVLRSPGEPLDAATRAFMARFGHDHDRELIQKHGLRTKEHYGAYDDAARWVLDQVNSRETDIGVAKWAIGILDGICPKETKE